MSKKVITFYDSEKQEHDFPIITPDYGVCDTIASDANKIVTCDEFTLFTGATVTVNFKNAPTTNTISLNVNDSGLIAVDFNSNDCVAKNEIKANGCYDFVYNGTKWIYKGSSANKVDKVSGKSLIDENVSKQIVYNPNDKYVHVDFKSTKGSGIDCSGIKIQHLSREDSSFDYEASEVIPYTELSGSTIRLQTPDNEATVDLSTTGFTIDNNKEQSSPSILLGTKAGDIIVHNYTTNEQHKLSEKANSSDVLEKTNTTEFTPTADYQPATKKYVDDSVSSAGSGDMLKSVYDKDDDGIIDDVALLQYYGTIDITISDSSYFTVNSTGETITGLTTTGKTQTELVIPYKINGVKITTLFSGSDSGLPVSILDGNSTITKVVIPKSVTTLGRGAFFSCAHLIDINIPDSVTSIGDNAFNSCTSLTSINIPDSVTSIRGEVFRNCSSLTSIDIPNSVTSIEYTVFGDCTSLTSITIPNSVTSIGNGAFSNCTNLKIYCEQGSYVETFAKGKNIPIVYTDIKTIALDNKVDKVEGKLLIDKSVADNLSGDTTTVRIKKGTELKTNGSEINGVRIDSNSVTVEDVKNDMSDPYIGYKNVMDKDGLHIYGVDPGGNQDTNERVDITSSGVKCSVPQGNGRTLKLGFEEASFPQLIIDGNPAENKLVKIDFDDVIVQNENTTHKLSEKVDKVEGKSLIDTGVANNISYASNSGFKLGNRWSFNDADMTHTSPAGGAMDLKFAIDSGLTLTTVADSGDFDITLVKGSKTHKLSEKLSTTHIVDGENAGSLKIGRTSFLSTEGPYSIAIGFNGHTGPDGMGAVAINGGEALGAGSVAINSCTAKGDGQIAFGKLNITDTDNKYACIIGNGHVDSKGNKVYSNAYTIDWNGNAWFAGDIEGVKNGTTHKLSEKVSFGDNYNTSAAGASDVPITLHGITEGAGNSNKPIGIKFNPGAGGGSTASITVGCDNSTDTATLSYNGLSIKSTAQYSAPDVRLTPLGLQTVNGSDMTQVKAGSVKCSVDNGNTWHELSEKAEAKTYTVSVPTTSWTEKTDTDNQKYYYKKITVSGMTASGQAMTDVAMSDSVATARKEMEAYQCVNRVVTGSGYVELYCFDEIPTTTFTLKVLVLGNTL